MTDHLYKYQIARANPTGEKFDETKMTALPPGSVFTEPGKAPHFTWAKDGEVMLHVTGRGPTATTWLDRKKSRSPAGEPPRCYSCCEWISFTA